MVDSRARIKAEGHLGGGGGRGRGTGYLILPGDPTGKYTLIKRPKGSYSY